ncbi:MAG: ribose-5-phosphate isomerase RpiA [Alphaproteobacteria bacterium]|jgi:ribose 5-phosphate isomerase A|nr:ribose-5-phosphate isomerase RpiA [Alphaproteobacteria bacterium]
MTDLAPLKRAAAAKALEYVVDGMKLGLGSGSTAELFVELLAPRIRGGQKLLCVPTSERTATLARKLGITLANLDDLAPLDLTVDGADEADRNLDLIKGGGGMLLREKIVAASSKKMIVIADESKLVPRLGKFPLPVEVVEFGHKAIAARLKTAIDGLGYKDVRIALRLKDGAPFKTDSGNLIYDCHMGAIQNADKLGKAVHAVPGVVEHGLFVGIATTLIIASPGDVEVIEK